METSILLFFYCKRFFDFKDLFRGFLKCQNLRIEKRASFFLHKSNHLCCLHKDFSAKLRKWTLSHWSLIEKQPFIEAFRRTSGDILKPLLILTPVFIIPSSAATNETIYEKASISRDIWERIISWWVFLLCVVLSALSRLPSTI